MATMTKQEQVKEYNNLHYKYNITGIKKMTTAEIESRIIYGKKSLDELYNTYSNAKRQSYADILATYQPQSILGLAGSCFSYSVLLVAGNGDKLLITKSNNYLVEEVK